MDFNFTSQITQAQYTDIKRDWLAKLEANQGNVSTSFYLARLEYCEHIVNGVGHQGNSRLCAVIDENGQAAAMLVATHGKAGTKDAMLKMMELSVQPELNLESSTMQEKELNEILATISAEAIIGCLGMTYDEFPANELKIYTDLPLSVEFLSKVLSILAEEPVFAQSFTLYGHGKWLVVKKKLI